MNLSFIYDASKKRATSSDPDIFVEWLSVTRERVYEFCLNWHSRRIVFHATVTVTGAHPTKHYHWIVTGLGKISLTVPVYQFESEAEVLDAADLVLKTMRVTPWLSIRGETPIVSAEISPQLKEILPTFPD